ncbi:M48 family metalloprotease [Salmonella enterica subsp. enterica serovar Saintpaul]|nr:M48 family metalloprotease [Salmonella enterica subsp. enterica serovar Saintpaul]
MGRLNQLSLYDESKLGVNLLIVFMCLSFYYHYGPLAAFYQIMIRPGEFGHSGFYDAIFLIIFTIVIGLYRKINRNIQYNVQALSLDERPIKRYCEKISKDFTQKKIDILTTSTMGINAYYQHSFFRPSIVLEKGILLQFIKGSDISGIVAHECAHIARKDYWYITFALNMTYAYIFLSIFKILIIEYHFWSMWLTKATELQGYPVRFYEYLMSSIPYALYNILSNILLIVMFSLIMRHFIRIRELLTDEFAAQKGYRKSISLRLSLQVPGKRKILSFHPSAITRKETLDNGQLWNRINNGFIFSITFITLGALSLAGSDIINIFSNAVKNNGNNLQDEQFGSLLVNYPVILSTFSILILISIVVLNHINRVSSSLIYKQRRTTAISWQMILCFIFSLLGCLVAIFFGSDLARNLTIIKENNYTEVIEDVLPPALIFICYFSLILFSGFLSSFIYMKFNIKSSSLRIVFLLFLWFILLVLLATTLTLPFLWAGYNIPAIRPIYVAIGYYLMPEFSNTFRGDFLQSIPVLFAVYPVEILFLFVITLIPLPKIRNKREIPYGLKDADSQKIQFEKESKNSNHRRLIKKIEYFVYKVSYPIINYFYTERSNSSRLMLTLATIGFSAVILYGFNVAHYFYPFTQPIAVSVIYKPTMKFQFNYPYGPSKGVRTWIKESNGVWWEIYPDTKNKTKFIEIGKSNIQGCSGIVVVQHPTPIFKIFIPDLGCNKMWLWMQNDKGQWGYLGIMKNIS